MAFFTIANWDNKYIKLGKKFMKAEFDKYATKYPTDRVILIYSH